uniref:Gamma-secretase subunit PEN-2 n=1 Tax=Attheya septentrionalis TaxID=420275 RepID=A0A7S2URL7_9STRA|mmetsp:Transcript_9585/g.17427  ORF Transcript_9585/g.17427 Transcript_9585/m.17427 type:complete len:141 (+) Transcript_9585:172-594(+)
MREDLLAKRMFWVGCCGLPWLWAVNVLYFRVAVFGPLKWVDSPSDDQDHAQMPPAVGQMMSDDTEDDGTAAGESATQQESIVSPEAIKKQVRTWVRRSTMGATTIAVIWIAWIISFQLNRDSFGPNWFIMSQDEADATGW